MKSARRNFVVGVASEFFWGMGFGLFMPPTLISLALVDLGGSSTLAGFLASIFSAGLTFPQAFSALAFSPRFTDPPRLVALHLPALLGPLIAGFGFLAVPGKYPGEILGILLSGFAVFSIGIGVVVPHWVGCIGRCIPEKIRGRYFGATFFASGLGSTVTGWLGARWAHQGGVEWGYPLCFLLAVPFMLLSLGSMLLFKPLAGRPSPPKAGALWGAFRMMNHKLTEPGPFRVGLVLVFLLTFSSASGNLFTVYLREAVKVDRSWFELYTPAMTFGATLGSFAMGWITDHRGLRTAYGVAFAAGLASMALILLNQHPLPPALAFGGFGLLNAAFPVVTLVMLLKLGGRKESTIQQGLFNTLMSPWSFLAPAAAGLLAAQAGYPWAFLMSAACCVAAFWILMVHPSLDGKTSSLPKRKAA